MPDAASQKTSKSRKIKGIVLLAVGWEIMIYTICDKIYTVNARVSDATGWGTHYERVFNDKLYLTLHLMTLAVIFIAIALSLLRKK